MSNNKMLIDATHPEETRVMVVRGNRIEEFDFESQEKRQLRGNIYLAKVTRVEPSLQAAFVDYGGNRHGFLAFSEIHPDYYQIPIADRQALLEQEAADARASAADEEEEDEKAQKKQSRGKKRQSRKDSGTKRGRKSKKDEDSPEDDEETVQNAAEGDSEDGADEEETRAETPQESAEEESSNADGDSDDADDGDTTIAAIVETDSISEPLPEGDDGDDDEGDGDETEPEAEATAEDKGEEKKKRRTTRRKPSNSRKKKVAEADDNKGGEETPEAEATDDDADAGENGDGSEDSDEAESVESVGQEDALEEVPERRRNRRRYKIQEVIKRRQVLLVQVVKEERGTKGAALTTYLSLAGRYSVLMPNTARGGGISRKITNAADRKRLKAIATDLEVPDGMGVILRTAGASRTKVEIKRDFEYLMRLWEQVRNLTLSSTAPCLVYEEGSLIKRSIRDLYDKETSEVLVAGEAGHTEAREFMSMLMPSHAKKVKLYTDNQSIYSKFGIDSQLEKMVSPQVTLKSGGYLVINQTEALVSVDVNSGRATREHSIEDTALKTNLEAAEEAARQLRLRDLAGLIVIDFIDMEEKRNNRAVEKKLKECLKNDRARIQVGRISHFGLLEMSRQRLRASVLESTMDSCPHCAGTGFVRSESAIALHVFRAIEEYLAKHRKNNVVVRTTHAIAMHILNYKKSALAELEARYGLLVMIEGDHEIKGQEFEIVKGPEARGATTNAIGHGDPGPAEENEENGRGRKRTRRRRRGRGSDNEAEAVSDSSGDETQEAAANSPDSNEDGDDDGKSKRKRRRGKRGGKSKSDETADAKSESENQEPTEPEKSEDSSEPEKPARKTSRSRRKKAEVDTKEEEAEATASSKEPQDNSNPEPSEEEAETRPKRRTTRRKSSTTQSAAEASSTEVKKEPPAEADDAPKKTGWWSSDGGLQ